MRHQPVAAREGRRVAREDGPPAAEALRRLEGDDPEGAARGRRHRDPALHPRRHHRRLPGGGPARPVREDDGLGRRVLPADGGQAAQTHRRVLEIGHQRYYNPIYQAAYDGIVKAGLLGEVYHARLVWHRNGNWRRKADLPSPDYTPAQWGYPTFDHLVNWRLYKQYSRGHMAELASHMVERSPTGSSAPTPTAAIGTRRHLPLQGRARGARTTPTRRSSTRAGAPRSSPRSSRTPSTTTTRRTTARRAR